MEEQSTAMAQSDWRRIALYIFRHRAEIFERTCTQVPRWGRADCLNRPSHDLPTAKLVASVDKQVHARAAGIFPALSVCMPLFLRPQPSAGHLGCCSTKGRPWNLRRLETLHFLQRRTVALRRAKAQDSEFVTLRL
jgi:hypothetical protein